LRAAALRLCLLKPFRYDSSSPTDSWLPDVVLLQSKQESGYK